MAHDKSIANGFPGFPQVDGLAGLPEQGVLGGTDSHGAAGAGGADGLALIVDCGSDGVGVAAVRMGRVSWPESGPYWDLVSSRSQHRAYSYLRGAASSQKPHIYREFDCISYTPGAGTR
jgi:hypothetical protein